jgi:hypothetical protein
MARNDGRLSGTSEEGADKRGVGKIPTPIQQKKDLGEMT